MLHSKEEHRSTIVIKCYKYVTGRMCRMNALLMQHFDTTGLARGLGNIYC